MLINIACCTMVCWGLFVQQQLRLAKKPLPPIPSLELRLVPSNLAHQFVRVEMFTAGLKVAEAKSGADSEPAVTFRAELADARAQIDRLERVIESSGDVVLRANSDAMIADRLRYYRDGLSMTPMQLLERNDRMREVTNRKIAEIKSTYQEKVDRKIVEYRKN